MIPSIIQYSLLEFFDNTDEGKGIVWNIGI